MGESTTRRTPVTAVQIDPDTLQVIIAGVTDQVTDHLRKEFSSRREREEHERKGGVDRPGSDGAAGPSDRGGPGVRGGGRTLAGMSTRESSRRVVIIGRRQTGRE